MQALAQLILAMLNRDQHLLRIGKAKLDSPAYLCIAPVRGYLISIECRKVFFDD